MGTLRPLLALTLLVLFAGCQTAKSPADLIGAPRDRESPTEVAAIEPPDADALSARNLPPPPEQFVPAPRLADIHFDYDAHAIRPEAARTLDENAAWLRANPGGLVLIEGHADERGTSE
jgi:outer membrane protein OmpA-like peptidoglycan-associated protein